MNTLSGNYTGLIGKHHAGKISIGSLFILFGSLFKKMEVKLNNYRSEKTIDIHNEKRAIVGKFNIMNKLRNIVAGVSFSIFLWAVRMSEDEYFISIYEQEQALKKSA